MIQPHPFRKLSSPSDDDQSWRKCVWSIELDLVEGLLYMFVEEFALLMNDHVTMQVKQK